MTPVSHGKPCAGNPHARFDEGASAPEEPRRKALLHNTTRNIWAALALVGACAATATGGIDIQCDYPGGNVKVVGIDEQNGVLNVAPDLRDTAGKWFHWDFTVRGAAGRSLHFRFPQDRFQYLSSLGPAISRDGGLR